MKIKFLKPFRFIGNSPNDGSDSTVPVGHVVDLENDESTQWLIDNGFAEEVKESGWWKPKYSEDYYLLNIFGEVCAEPWTNVMIDEFRYSVGNCFKTKKAAEAWKGYRIAITTVRQDEGVLTPEQIRDVFTESSQGVFIVINDVTGCRRYVTDTRLIHTGDICFDTREHAKTSLDKHPDEWKIIASYDWSRE